MENRMTDEQRDRRREKTQLIVRITAAVLGMVSAASFFLPYLTFIFRKQVYTVSALQLLTVRGFRVRGPQMEGIVTIPVLARASVVVGLALAVAGVVLILLKRAVPAGACFILSALTPLLVLISTGEIQSAVTQLNVVQMSVRYLTPFFLVLALGVFCAVLSLWTMGSERLAQSIFLVCACGSIGSVLIITIYVIVSGAPAIGKIGLLPFLFGTKWAAGSGQFGILPMILSSIAATVGAVLLGVPVGIFTAVFLSETAQPAVAKAVHPAVELLAGIPSVIYGFFGMLVVVPFIKRCGEIFHWNTQGDSLLAAILILAVMVLPTIVSVSETALRAVPDAYREASMALGATPVRTIFKVTLPAARSGVLSGVILGVGRAVGETMAVIMVAGNVANMPRLLGSVRFLTTGIALELSYSSGLHRQALFAIGLVLFVFIMIVDVLFTYISRKGVKMDAE
ncbi:MAG: phosphate ABC transporter permease subunit PstC [Oscillospiraceae bacterium]|jgi:phosphate ABC transporter permease protein PstC|nr:phosphate ABC transporter permease subunit PstC [Oscillospiraceae bacterium]